MTAAKICKWWQTWWLVVYCLELKTLVGLDPLLMRDVEQWSGAIAAMTVAAAARIDRRPFQFSLFKEIIKKKHVLVKIDYFCCWKLVKDLNFDQKSKFWSKIENLIKNPNFDQKLKFWWKIENLVKNPNFDQKSKVKILVNNWNFCQKPKFCLKKWNVRGSNMLTCTFRKRWNRFFRGWQYEVSFVLVFTSQFFVQSKEIGESSRNFKVFSIPSGSGCFRF